MSAFFSKLRSELKIGTIVTIFGLFIAAFNSIFGAGTPFDFILHPQLRYKITQIESTNASLNECVVENLGNQLAENLVIQLTFEDDVFLLEDLIIKGGDGQHEIQSGGVEGDSHATILLDRLVAKDRIIFIMPTNKFSTFICDVTSNAGKAMLTTEENSFFTINILFWGQIISTFLIVLILLSLRNAIVTQTRFLQIEKKREQTNDR